MIKFICICFLLFSFNVFSKVKPKESQKFIKIQVKDMKKSLDWLRVHEYDIAGYDLEKKSIGLIVNNNQIKKLNKKNILIEGLIETRSLKLDAEYKTPEEVEQILKNYAQKFPEILSLREVGKSLLGKSIYAVKITDNPNKRELEEPTILFNGLHHAREVMTVEVNLDIIETLTAGYNKDSQITNWVDNNEVWVIPMFNVDGSNIVWTKNNMWRKNARGNYGVDINRNYPFKWASCMGSSSNVNAQDYHGTGPASEPETQTMMNVVKLVKPVFDISFHSYSELVIFPFGCKGERTPTKEVVEKVGKEMASLLPKESGNGTYSPGTAWELLYAVDGGDIDWMYNDYQVIPFVIEVNQEFQPNYSQFRDKTVIKMRLAWQHLLKQLDASGIRGVVRSSQTHEVLSNVEVKIEKLVNNTYQDYQIYTGNFDGTYHLVLNPGAYKLSFSTNDIDKKIVEKVVTDKRIELNIEL